MTEFIEYNNFKKFKLTRSISCPVDTKKNSSQLHYEEPNVPNLPILLPPSSQPNSKIFETSNMDKCNSNIGIVSKYEDPGYTRHRKITISNKIYSYTEDRTWNSIIKISNKDYNLLCVADGHGKSYECSKFVINRIVVFSNKISLESYDPTDFINKLFNFIFEETLDSDLDFEHTGTTLCIGLVSVKDKILTVGNLGDSVCQVIRHDPITNTRSLAFKTIDHDAGNLLEQARIRAINPFATFIKSNKNTVRLDGKLMVVRGFGDWHYDKPFGVIGRNPDIYSEIKLESNDVVIISSDGLFEQVYESGIRSGRNVSEIINDIDQFFLQSTEQSISKFLHNNHIQKMTDRYISLYKQDSNPLLRENYIKIISESNDNNAILSIII